MPYIPALDGVRAVAIGLVLLFHARIPGLPGGNLGVDIFFVLSGFLITRLLLCEQAEGGRINLRRFYMRRALRLTPPLLFCLLLYALAAPLVWPEYPFHLRDGLMTLFYAGNLAAAAGFLPEKLNHGWSLGLEEQFYLLWPLLLGWALYAKLGLWRLLLAAYVLLNLWRWLSVNWLSVPLDVAYYRPDLHCSGLVLGAVLAAWLHGRPNMPLWLGRPFFWLCLVMLAIALFWPRSQAMHLQVFVPLAELCTAGLLLYLVISPDGRRVEWLSAAPMLLIGKLSYGLYLFHYPLMRALHDYGFSWLWVLILGGSLSLLLAGFSYFTIEAWVRRYRQARYAEPDSARG